MSDKQCFFKHYLEQPMTEVTFLPLKCPVEVLEQSLCMCVCGIEMSLYTVKQQLVVIFLWSVLLTLAFVTDLGAATHKVCLLFTPQTGRNWASAAVRFRSLHSHSHKPLWSVVRYFQDSTAGELLPKLSSWSERLDVLPVNSTSIFKLGACQQTVWVLIMLLYSVW